VSDHLIQPHGGQLVHPIVEPDKAEELKAQSTDWPSWDLTDRQICDLELILNGGFSPLTGFLGQKDYDSVCTDMHLSDGTLWPVPIVQDISGDFANTLNTGDSVALRDPEGVMLAALHVEEIWQPDRESEVEQVYGSKDLNHPGVSFILNQTHPYYVSGRLEGLQIPVHYDYRALRLSPGELRTSFTKAGWRRIVAFQTRNPMHRAHQELTIRASEEVDANLLIHPVTGMTKPGDIDHYTRVRCYQAILSHYTPEKVKLSLLPLAMRMAGPREALLHAIIRKNYGCTHFIVGRDHAGPGSDPDGKPFYGPYEAQEVFRQHENELGVEMVPFQMMVYVEEMDRYFPIDEVPAGKKYLSISGTELREKLATGAEIPKWFSFADVVTELRKSHPARNKQGVTVFLTGLSGSGKSTVANVLLVKFLEMGGRPVTLLDGDIVRRNLSSELGFSKEHRDLNIRRIGFVAREITKNGGIAICAPIAPYDNIRQENRELIESVGGYQLIHVATPLEVCEQRDRKGLYAKARAGIIKEFTGISDPYEEPEDADVVIDTTELSPEEAAQRILLHLEREGFIGPNANNR